MTVAPLWLKEMRECRHAYGLYSRFTYADGECRLRIYQRDPAQLLRFLLFARVNALTGMFRQPETILYFGGRANEIN